MDSNAQSEILTQKQTPRTIGGTKETAPGVGHRGPNALATFGLEPRTDDFSTGLAILAALPVNPAWRQRLALL